MLQTPMPLVRLTLSVRHPPAGRVLARPLETEFVAAGCSVLR